MGMRCSRTLTGRPESIRGFERLDERRVERQRRTSVWKRTRKESERQALPSVSPSALGRNKTFTDPGAPPEATLCQQRTAHTSRGGQLRAAHLRSSHPSPSILE